MTRLDDHTIPAPDGWPTSWVNRDLPALNTYISVVSIALGLAVILTQLRGIFGIRRAQRELAANPSDRALLFKKVHKRALKTDRGLFKIALVFIAHTLVMTLVDGIIAVFVLVNDANEHPDVWDREMFMAIGLYSFYLLGLFLASFVLFPLLQMYAVTWGLTNFSRKHVLSDYVPQARTYSTIIALGWAVGSFVFITGFPIVGDSEHSAMRFVVLEAVWGSALAWIEASLMFNFFSDAIGDKEIVRGNVGEIVSLFAKAATASFSSKSKEDLLPKYEAVAKDEPRGQ